MLPPYAITLSSDEQAHLEALRRAGKTPQPLVPRAASILLAQDGLPNQQSADAGAPRALWGRSGASALPCALRHLSGPTRQRQRQRRTSRRPAGSAPVGSPAGGFPLWPATPSSPWPAQARRSGSCGAFSITACGIWPAWWQGAGKS